MFLPVMSLGRASKLGSSLYKLPVFFFFSVVKQFESNRNIRNKLSDEVEWTWTSFFSFFKFFSSSFLGFVIIFFFYCCCRYWACIRMDKLWQALAEETWQISVNTDWLILPEGPWLIITLSETQISIVTKTAVSTATLPARIQSINRAW